MNYLLLTKIFEGLDLFLRILSVVLIAYGVLSWFVRPENPLFQAISRFAQPLLAPFRSIARKLLDRGFMIDVSLFLALIAIQVLQYLLVYLFRFLVTLG